ncbi:MAG: tyrosine-type recombinase/integrase [Endomicrobium sp.]|jgi:integrase|nr:tyrosine-type recombinase/integrase [Endomicrobium sp.]
MSCKLEKKNNKWSFRYRQNEKKCRYTCKSLIHAEAKEEQLEFLNSLRALKGKRNSNDIIWDDFCRQFLNFIRDKKGYETYLLHINNFNKITPIKYLSQATTDKFNDYKNSRLISGIKKSTINRELNTFRAMFTWAIDVEDFVLKHPLNKKIKKYEVPAVVKERVLSPEEIKKALSSISLNRDFKGKSLDLSNEIRDMLLALLHLGLYAGLRLKEGKLIKRKDMLLNERLLVIAPQKTAESDANVIKIPMAAKLKDFFIKILKKYPNEIYATPGLTEEERKSRSANISHLISDTLKRCGILNASMHTCRHTFISNLANNPNIKDMELLEYSRIRSMEVLKIYRHITPEIHIHNIDSLTY